jgi:hypothetical protein
VSDHEHGPSPAGSPAGARPAALLVVRITPDDVGTRVSIRHRLDGSTLTDVVGHLVSWADAGPEGTGGRLTIRRRDGTLVAVLAATMVAAKVVPEPPAAPHHRRD